MAKSRKQFDLGKDSGHEFNLGKGSKRKFDLSKEDDTPVGAPLIDTENVTPTVDPLMGEISPETMDPIVTREKKQMKWGWVWIALGVIAAFLCILFLWLLPMRDKDKDSAPEEVNQEVVVPTTDENADNVGGPTDVTTPETSESAETVETPETSATTTTSSAPEAVAPAEQPAPQPAAETAAPATQPAAQATDNAPEEAAAQVKTSSRRHHSGSSVALTATSADVTDDYKAEAMKVIRGEYGNNPDRKRILGDRYRKIQKHVNKLKRRGKF